MVALGAGLLMLHRNARGEKSGRQGVRSFLSPAHPPPPPKPAPSSKSPKGVGLQKLWLSPLAHSHSLEARLRKTLSTAVKPDEPIGKPNLPSIAPPPPFCKNVFSLKYHPFSG